MKNNATEHASVVMAQDTVQLTDGDLVIFQTDEGKILREVNLRYATKSYFESSGDLDQDIINISKIGGSLTIPLGGHAALTKAEAIQLILQSRASNVGFAWNSLVTLTSDSVPYVSGNYLIPEDSEISWLPFGYDFSRKGYVRILESVVYSTGYPQIKEVIIEVIQGFNPSASIFDLKHFICYTRMRKVNDDTDWVLIDSPSWTDLANDLESFNLMINQLNEALTSVDLMSKAYKNISNIISSKYANYQRIKLSGDSTSQVVSFTSDNLAVCELVVTAVIESDYTLKETRRFTNIVEDITLGRISMHIENQTVYISLTASAISEGYKIKSIFKKDVLPIS